jgi:RHH-type rel operon transcriptional repressor/antitoxin RelB
VQQLSIKIKDPILNRLDNLSKKTGRSKSYYVMEALAEHIEDLEDIYLAEKRLEDIKAGKERVYSQKEIEAEYGGKQ